MKSASRGKYGIPRKVPWVRTNVLLYGSAKHLATTELEDPPRGKKRSREEVPTARKKGKRKPRQATALQRFRQQTILKKRQLRNERKRIERELKSIEKDLGVLKRKKIIKD